MKLAITTLFIVVSMGVFAQSGKLKKADNFYNRLSYAYAANTYEELLGSEVDSPEMKGKLAYCYLKMDDYPDAVAMYAQMIESQSAKSTDYYNYSVALKYVGNYEESDKWMNIFAAREIDDSRAKLFLANQNYKKEIEQLPPFFSVNNLDINSDVADFGGYYSTDSKAMYFITSRRENNFIKRTWGGNGGGFLDIFKTNIDSNQVSDQVKLAKKVNSKFHEGPMCFSPDGKTVYYTRNNISSGKKRRDVSRVQNLKLYISTVDDEGKWMKEHEFPYNSKDYSIGHPTITKDGKTLYFISDKPGGIGETDLYKVAILEGGQFGEMINLGPTINTEGREMFPFIDQDNRLFFSSDGRPGLGGLDVYIAIFNGDHISKIANLGRPVNSQSDDFAGTLSKDFKFGYVSSNREGGKGSDDIYSMKALRPITFTIAIQGKAKDKKNELIPFAKIELKDDKGEVLQTVTADDKGQFTFNVDFDKNYGLKGSKEKYFDGYNKANTFTDEAVVYADVILEKDPGLSLYVLVKDSKSKAPLELVKVNMVDNFNSLAMNVETPPTGDFRQALNTKKLNDRGSYNFIFQKDGYLSKSLTYNVLFDHEGQYDVIVEMDPEVKDLRDLVNINAINFDLDKYNIRPDAAKELDKIVDVMNKYPNMVIELGAHTDCRASEAYNMRLSDRRAKSSAEYIQKRITHPERIFGKGYGESRLLNGCACEGAVKSDCSEEEHQKNRRTEFRVISTGNDKLKVVNSSTDSF